MRLFKALLAAVFLSWASVAGAQTTLTTNLGLSKPEAPAGSWGALINSNFDALDAKFPSATATTIVASSCTGTDKVVGVTVLGALICAADVGASGVVSSVGLSLPAIFSVTGTPVTTAGTLTAALATQTANTVWSGPASGAVAAPTFRLLVDADIPAVLTGKTLTGATFSTGSIGASVTGVVNSLAGTTNRLTASASSGAVTLNVPDGVIDGSSRGCVHVGSTDDYACTPTIAPTAYVTRGHYPITPNVVSTGASSVNIASLGVRNIKKYVSGAKVDTATGDICAQQPIDLVYDGVDMILMTPLCNPSTGGGSSLPALTEDADSVNSSKALEACPTTCAFGMDTTIFTGALKTWGYPANAGDTYVGAVAAQTLTNKTMSGAANTFTNIAPASLTAVANRRVCMITVGNGTDTVVDADLSPFKQGRCYIPHAGTVVEIVLQGDAGTPTVLLQRRRDAATLVDLLSPSALPGAGTTETCATAVISTACINGTTSSGTITLSNTSLAAGDWIEVKSGTGSTAKAIDIAVVYTVN